jgi:hypothetical protein
VAIIGSVTVSTLDGPFRQDFAGASHVGWWILTACGVSVLGLGLLASGRWAERTAHRTARLLMPATGDGDASTGGAGEAGSARDDFEEAARSD